MSDVPVEIKDKGVSNKLKFKNTNTVREVYLLSSQASRSTPQRRIHKFHIIKLGRFPIYDRLRNNH